MEPQSRTGPRRSFRHIAGAILCALALSAPVLARVSTPAPVSGIEVIAHAEERFQSLRDYECAVEVQSDLGKRVETGAAKFWYKQPGMLRVNITRGSKRGTVVAVDRGGKIRGHKGGLLSGIVRSMKPNDKRLLTIRGTSLLSLDWGSFYRKFREGAIRPAARIIVEPRSDPTAPHLVSLSSPADGKDVREVYTIEPQRWIMVEGSTYEGDARVEHVLFQDVKLDTGVEDGWFRL